MNAPPALAAVEPLAALAPLQASASNSAASVPDAASFGALVRGGLNQVNRQLLDSDAGLQQMALGQGAELHRVMLQLEETRLGFQLLMQLRNRALEAYQDLMRMPV